MERNHYKFLFVLSLNKSQKEHFLFIIIYVNVYEIVREDIQHNLVFCCNIIPFNFHLLHQRYHKFHKVE